MYWQHFVLHWSAGPSIANLYTKTCTMLWAGLEEAAVVHGILGWAGNLELWLDMQPHLLVVLDIHHALSRSWVYSRTDLHGTHLLTA